MRTSVLVFCALVLVIPTTLCAQPKRVAVPDEAVLNTSKKVVAEAYKREYTAAKTAPQKQAFARKLLADAEQTKDDPAARYAMLQVARNVAADIGDIELAMQVVQKISDQYEVDGDAARLEVLKELSSMIKTDGDALAFGRFARQVLATMVKSEQFATAKKLAELARSVSGKSRDADLAKEWTRRSAEVTWQADLFNAAEQAQTTLATAPTTAPANAIVGKYQCFVRGDWETGLAMLAIGDDKALQPPAELELQRANATKLSLAWDEAAKTLTNELQIGALRRAEKWYRVARRSAQGLEQRRIDQRLEEMLPQTSLCRVGEWLELLDFVDPQRHAFNSPVSREGSSIVIQDHRDQGYFTIPVSATGNYELRVRAMWVAGRDEGIGIRLPGANGALYFFNAYSASASGIGQIDGKDVNGNASTVRGAPTTQGIPYEILVRFERKGDQRLITATLNGRKYSRYVGPLGSFSSLGTIPWHPDQFGVADWWKVLVVQSMDLKVLDGGAYLTE